MQGTDLRALRQGLGMSQLGFAEAIGMSRKAINEMESGKAAIERRTELAARYIEIASRTPETKKGPAFRPAPPGETSE